MRIHRRWLIRIAIALALAMAVIGVFVLGVLVGEWRSARSARGGAFPPGARPSMGEPERPPWPLGPWLDFHRHGAPHGVRGVVDEIDNGVIMVTTHRDTQVRIIVTAKTMLQRGRERITLDDVHSGDRIAVIGEPRGEDEIEAKVVWVIPEESRNEILRSSILIKSHGIFSKNGGKP